MQVLYKEDYVTIYYPG